MLCAPSNGPRPCVGVLRHPQSWTRGFFCAGWIRNGHVSHAPNRYARCLRASRTARFHGISQLGGTALVLVRLRCVLVCHADGCSSARIACAGVRLARVPFKGHRRVSLDHDASPNVRAVAGVLSKRDGVWRQQWPHRLQRHPGRVAAVGRHTRCTFCRFSYCAGVDLFILPLCRDVETWARRHRRARCR